MQQVVDLILYIELRQWVLYGVSVWCNIAKQGDHFEAEYV